MSTTTERTVPGADRLIQPASLMLATITSGAVAAGAVTALAAIFRAGGVHLDAGGEIPLREGWCQNGTMRRMNLRDVPDDVYSAIADAATANRQSLSAYVVDRLTEAAEVARLADYLATYQPPAGSGVTLEDAAAAVREVREAS